MARILGDLKERTVAFGTNVLQAVRALPNDPGGWTVSKQVLPAATSVGANVWEAGVAQTDSDFAHTISIARKEACAVFA
jgi:four helix bundle protein